jgi:hypothetical protein
MCVCSGVTHTHTHTHTGLGIRRNCLCKLVGVVQHRHTRMCTAKDGKGGCLIGGQHDGCV